MKMTGKVFSFTLIQHMKSKGYRTSTLAGILLCLFLPALILPLLEATNREEVYVSRLEKVYVIDSDAEHPADYALLNAADGQQFTDLVYETASSLEEAQASLDQSGEEYAAFLVVEIRDGIYQVNVLRPEDTALTKKDTRIYEDFLNQHFQKILVQKSGLDMMQIAELTTPVQTEIRESGQEEVQDEFSQIRKGLATALPYLNIMILYFMVLAYGQGTANSTIMEKTSKLMDLFLVSVKPGSMLLGKVLAIALSGMMQLFFWLAALAGGFFAGVSLVKVINPQTDMLLVRFMKLLGHLSGMFSWQGILLSLIMMAAGFLLYCSLAAIGGALAGKPEDLSNTNVLFVMVLIISFFATMYSGGFDADVPWGAQAVTWQNWVPFTAIMVMPSKMLLGTVPLLHSMISIALVILSAVLITLMAGKLYRMMSLYKGNPPGVGKILEMMKQDKK